jgi:UDP-4-amino-4,6-dideoxy-N-acetyl-beta-L-altrosamine transaminase
MMTPIPYGRQDITQADIDAVVEALQSDYLTQGPTISQFEREFAAYTGANFAIALSNGTAALHLSVMALGIEPGDYVICTPITFAASVNCVRYCGGNILFADIDPETYLMDINQVKALIHNNQDKRIVGIIPVDFAGRLVDLTAFRALADEIGAWLLEDACHAPGGSDAHGNKAGGGLADASIFSFHPVKHIATGEGGMITTNNEALYKRLMTIRTHGITRDTTQFKNSTELANGNSALPREDYPGWYMEMQELGYNYRITDIQAALGLSQLKRAEAGLNRRREIAQFYATHLAHVRGIIRQSNYIPGHAYHLYVLEVEDRRGLYDFLREKGIYCQIHYFPTHLMPYYQEQGWQLGDLPLAEAYYERCISLPMFPTLTDEQLRYIVEQIELYYS